MLPTDRHHINSHIKQIIARVSNQMVRNHKLLAEQLLKVCQGSCVLVILLDVGHLVPQVTYALGTNAGQSVVTELQKPHDQEVHLQLKDGGKCIQFSKLSNENMPFYLYC